MKKIFIILAIIGLVACKPNSPSAYRGLPKEYKLAFQEIYGHCYDSVPYAVVALDLYSEGITLNKEHLIQGTGYNLYLSDIFVPDSLLAQGEYKSLNIQHSTFNIQPYTFLPGRDYEGTPHGMYILDIQDDKIANIQVLDSGSFVFKGDSLLFTLYYTNSYGSRATYTCHFAGGLIPWPKL
jgi:hypothetical protein